MKYDIESIKKRKQKTHKVKKVIDIILIILIYNVVIITILCLNKIEPISIFGYRAFVITTSSMEPEISVNDIIIVKQANIESIQKGDIITFYQNKETISHRVVNIEENDAGEKQYVTKGDNNNVEDINRVQYGDIAGKLEIKIPKIGIVIRIMENKIVFLSSILCILILWFIKINIQEKKESRREKKNNETEKNKQK